MTVDREELANLVVTLAIMGHSRRRIAEDLKVSRNTVRRILERVELQRQQGHSALPSPPVRRGSTLDDYASFIASQLEDFPKITAVRLHENLCEEGFTGGYTIVKERLRKLRPRPKKEPSGRIETGPGEQGQQDWSPYVIPFTETGRQKVHCFSLVLSYSRRQYIHFCENEKYITLIREHRKAFEYFGGLPRKIIYDGQKAVVPRWEAGRPIYNTRFLAFATHYGFRPWAYRGKPQWKGKVERPFWYVELNLLGGRKFRNIDHLNEVAQWWLEHRADVRKHGTLRERPIDRFVIEAPLLLPLPAHPYDTSEVGYRVVSTQGEVKWGVTPYSVSYDYILDLVVVRVTEDEVFIYDSDLNDIARHRRAPKEQVEPVEDPKHRTRKKRRHDINVLAKRMGELCEHGAEFATGVLKKQRYRGSHLAQVLGLLERYSADDMNAALERAVRYRAFDAQMVQRILEASATPRVLPDTALEAAQRLKSALPPIAPRPLEEYDAALRGYDEPKEEP